MTRKELREVLDEAVGQPPRVDLAEAAWAQGVGMRRRRRAVLACGGALLTAAAVVGALVISGGIAPDQDVAPAVPTSTPGPTQVEPGPADLTQARTYLFNRTGTSTDLEASSLELLSGQDVPSVADLTGSSWELVPMDRAGEAQEFIEIDLAGPDDAGAAEPTTLSFMRAENGDTLLSMSIDVCGGATFQEDLTLGAQGRFAGQPAATDDQGCPEDVQAAEDFWMEVLPTGGWVHQPHEDVLLLSVIVPEDAAPARETTTSPTTDDAQTPPDLAEAHTLVFQVPGSDTAFDAGTVPPLAEQQVPTREDLTGSSWELIPIDLPWYAKGPDEASGITILSGTDFDSRVSTTLAFPAAEPPKPDTLLTVALADCGAVTLAEEGVILNAEGRFPAQQPMSTVADCEPAVPGTFWFELLAQGGWLHQPSADVLLLSVVAPDGLLPAEPQVPDVPDLTQGVEALGLGAGLPAGWTELPLAVALDAHTTTTCLLPEEVSELFHAFAWCTAGIEVRTGVDPEASAIHGGWWDPTTPDGNVPLVECYVTRQDYGAPENAVTVEPTPETGSTTIAGHPVEWFRWSASCAEGQQFTTEAWRVTDLGIELRSMDGSQAVEPLVSALLADGEATTMGQFDVEVTEPIGDNLTGELQVWNGIHQGSGEQVTFEITEDTRCLVTKPGGELGADLELGACGDLATDLATYSIARVIVTPAGEALTVHVPATF